MWTGFYVRIQRDGNWQSFDLSELTIAELEAWVETLDHQARGRWLKAFVLTHFTSRTEKETE